MKKIFISYSATQADLADYISHSLQEEGFDAILNDPILANYYEHKSDLHKKIAASDVFIIIAPIHNSGNDEMERHFFNEVQYLKSYIKNLEENKLLIPVIQEGTEYANNEIFMGYQTLKYTPFDSHKDVFLKIFRIINAFIGRKTAEMEKDSAIKERIESSSGEYVERTLKELKIREERLSEIANNWYIAGYVSIVIAIIVTGVLFFSSLSGNDPSDFSSGKIFYASLKSIVIVLLFIAASKYSFDLAKTYMNESLKNSDRIHAISFGRFYMQIFGENVNPEEIMNVFQYWNINNNSSFSSLNSKNFDPSLFEHAIKIIETVKNFTNGKKI